MKRKSIVLSDTDGNTSKKAVLTLEENGNGLLGTLRLYNFPQEPNGILSLGFFSNKKVEKAGLTRKSQMLYDFYVNIKEIPQKFSCAVVNFQNADPKPVLYGSSEGNADDVYANIISEISKDGSYQNTKNVLDKYDVNFAKEEKEEIEKEIDENLCHENCANCIYKKYFFENAQNEEEPVLNNFEEIEISTQNKDYKSQIFGSQSETGEENSFFEDSSKNDFFEKTSQSLKDFQPQKEQEEKEEKIIFFDRLKPQIDKLFENNPTENNLQNIFPSSKWVKVEYEDEGDFFVFGLLYDENENVKYVCYGVPSVFGENPPEELDGFPIWLPLDEKDGFGYWMTYQDAVTGEPIQAILD